MAKKRAGQERKDLVPAAANRSDGRRTEDVLRPIVDGITSQVGEQFFRALVRHLAAALKVRFAFISEQLDHEGARVRLVAFWEVDDYGQNFEYPTTGTPCEHVVGKRLASFPSGLRELFPEDAWLKEVGAESYLAIPLFDSTERPLGHLGVMHDEPMCEELLNEQILRIFAGRAAGELERKRAEEALRESEERYRALVETSPDGISLTDLEGRILFCNKQALALLGFESLQEVLGKSAFDLIAAEDRQRAVDNAQKTLNMKSISHVEYTLVRKDGSRFPAELGASLVVDAEGKPKGFIGVLRDITARKRAEEELRESEERLKILFESAPDAYYLNDLEGRFVDGNRGAEEISGYKRDELIGQSFLSLKLLSPEEISKAAVLLARNAQGEATGPDEFTLNRKDGSQVAVEIRTFVVRITGEVLVLGSARDITERKRAEEELRESEEGYRELVEEINDVIYEVDTSGRITYISPVAEEVSGYNPTEIIGRSIVEFMPPEEVPARLDSFREGLSGQPIPTEFSLVSKSGEIRWIHTSGRVIREGDRITGFRGVLTDITDRKRAEEALRHSEEKYRALYEDNPSMYFTVDAEGTVLSVNRFGAEQLGYTVDELVGQSVLNVFYEADKEAVQKQLSICIQNSAEVADWEFRNVRKDGSILWVKEAARAVRGPDGGTIVLIVCEDITQRKEAEEALQIAREELESKVESRMRKGNPYGLTFRELTALHLVAEGKSDKEIATLLGISPRTANKHLENILSKMGASSRTEAGVRAVRERLLGR